MKTSYLTRFANFSSVVKAATRAAARSGGDRVKLHTWLFDNGGFVQSAKGSKKAAWAVETEANTARLQDSMTGQKTDSDFVGE